MTTHYLLKKTVTVNPIKNPGTPKAYYAAMHTSTNKEDPNFEITGLVWDENPDRAFKFRMFLTVGSLSQWLCNDGYRRTQKATGLFARTETEDEFSETIELIKVDEGNGERSLVFQGSYYQLAD